MDKIIEAVLKLIPFAVALGVFKFSKETTDGIIALVIAILLYVISPLIKKAQERYKNAKVTRDLAPYFDYQKVKQSLDMYIPTRFQNFSPAAEDEPSYSGKFVAQSRLIPFFLKTGFNEKKETDKFYLVLADSGMGKTTFMINLYVNYNSMFNFGKKYKIKLLPFGDSRIIEQLKEMAKKPEEVRNTILLLDAFDEYKGLLPPETPDGLTDDMRFRKQLDEIVELTRDFREVVITSRTQYFPGQENQAYELKVQNFNNDGFHTLAKLYLSPFDSAEIRQYLNKKYGRFTPWTRKLKHNAKRVVESTPKLMVRPMLLSYIDYLVDSQVDFDTAYQIYDTLIAKWIEREANKRKYESTTREQFKRDLYQFSMLVAVEIYKQHKQTGNLSINKETATLLCQQQNVNLKDYEITGQSLLTRDITHNWKFSHKSILEFFLAKQCIENENFAIQFEFEGMDVAKNFYEEKTGVPVEYIKFFSNAENKKQYALVKEGTFKVDNKYPVKISTFAMSKYQVTQAEYIEITQKENPSHFKDNPKNPVETVSWHDAAILQFSKYKKRFETRL